MAKANTTTTVGIRETLLDLISLSEPEMTPVTSLARKKTATGTFVEHQVDSYEEPNYDGVDEGKDIDSFEDASKNRARIGNYIQIFRRNYQVSNVEEKVNKAGVKSEFARSKMIKSMEHKRDIESAICSSQDRQQQGGTGTPYKTRGFFRWLGWNGSAANNYDSDVPTDQQIDASQDASSLTETQFNDLFEVVFNNNGAPRGTFTLVSNPALKQRISLFSRADTTSNDTTYTVTQSAESKKMTLCVNMYDGDFGKVNILSPSLFLDRASGGSATADERGLVIDPSCYSLSVLSSETHTELENKGGGRRGYMETMLALTMDCPKAHAYLY